MIWALLAWLLFDTSTGMNALMLNAEGADRLISSIEVVVTDEVRQQNAIEHVNELKSEMAVFERVFSETGKQLNRLVADHEDTTSELNTLFSDLNDTWEAGQARVLDERFELRKIMTAAEWQIVFGTDHGSH